MPRGPVHPLGYDAVTPRRTPPLERHDDVTAPDPAPDRAVSAPSTRRLLVAFAPYLAVAIVHLVTLMTGADDAARLSKLLLMPALALAVVLALLPMRGAAAWLLLAAIVLSWGGDASLTLEGEWWFIVGLGSFLLAHLAYIALFLRLAAKATGRRFAPWSLVYALWYVAFLALLAPHLGGLLLPVAVYGAVLGTMAALASARGPFIAAGGALFVLSDSVLALGRFLPGYEFAAHDLTVMASYLAAQGLIAWGVVRSIRGGRPVQAPPPPAPGRRASATAP
jgi:uncharacterized membrane protein YhhN